MSGEKEIALGVCIGIIFLISIAVIWFHSVWVLFQTGEFQAASILLGIGLSAPAIVYYAFRFMVMGILTISER